MAETDREVLQDMYAKGVYIRGKNRGGGLVRGYRHTLIVSVIYTKIFETLRKN